MSSDPAVLAKLLSQCEKEPIHIPGAIQPFGVLLTVDPRSLIIQNVSENAAFHSGLPVRDLLGRPLTELMSREVFHKVKGYLDASLLAEQTPLLVTLLPGEEKGDQQWELSARHCLDTLYLELEPVAADVSSCASSFVHDRIREVVRVLQSADSLQDLCDKAVRQVRETTGFDRVMIYRFDEDWHGMVAAEARSQSADSYLGHHFPASDIPAQARSVFLQNWLRMIPDVDYLPSRIHPGVHAGSGAPLDLGKVLLRSVSPIHLEYLRNMGVKASLTVSLVDEGKLWGLIACHHATPLLTNSDARMVVEMIARLVSSQLRIKMELEDRQYKVQLGQRRIHLMDLLARESDLAAALAKHSHRMLDMVSAVPSAVAICYGKEWTIVGETPPIAELEKIVTWLANSFPDTSVFETSRLSSCFPDAAAYQEAASGLIALSITRAERDYVLWFRPEVAATVTWAGAPDKPARQSGDLIAIHPRASFKSWKEVVRGTAIPWKSVEIGAVEDLRNGIIGLALQQEYRKEQEARKRAERLSREKDEMVMMVSHDLRTPLNVIAMSLEFLGRFHPNQEPPLQRMLERGARATSMMEKLITNILDLAKIEAGTLDLEFKPEDALGLVREVVDVSAELAAQKGVQLVCALPDEPYKVRCERIRIVQVLNNLVGNALKFTSKGGKVIVSARGGKNEVQFSVSDTGEGMSPEIVERIFERFWQAEDSRRRGTGLGLWISKGIIERHGGRIWATSEPGVGSTFDFTLPRTHC